VKTSIPGKMALNVPLKSTYPMAKQKDRFALHADKKPLFSKKAAYIAPVADIPNADDLKTHYSKQKAPHLNGRGAFFVSTIVTY